MARQAIKVIEVLNRVNKMLAVSTCSVECRKGMAAALEAILHDCDAYEGFRYLTKDEVPKDHLPGIDDEKRFPDESRVCYLTHKRLLPKEASVLGYVRNAGGPLGGERVRLVRRQLSGGALVEVIKDRGAYKAGDQVQLGTGEFIAD